MQIIVRKSLVIRTETQASIPLIGLLTGLFWTFRIWLELSVSGSVPIVQKSMFGLTLKRNNRQKELQRPSQLQLWRNLQLGPRLFESNIIGSRSSRILQQRICHSWHYYTEHRYLFWWIPDRLIYISIKTMHFKNINITAWIVRFCIFDILTSFINSLTFV